MILRGTETRSRRRGRCFTKLQSAAAAGPAAGQSAHDTDSKSESGSVAPGHWQLSLEVKFAPSSHPSLSPSFY